VKCGDTFELNIKKEYSPTSSTSVNSIELQEDQPTKVFGPLTFLFCCHQDLTANSCI
jgi:hypothetical protein